MLMPSPPCLKVLIITRSGMFKSARCFGINQLPAQKLGSSEFAQ
jgi:hypothetical protein